MFNKSKNIINKFLVFIVLIVIFINFSCNVFANYNNSIKVIDFTKKLSEKNINILNKNYVNFYKKYNFDILAVYTDNVGNYSTKEFIKKLYYDYNFYKDGISLIVDYQNRRVELVRYGKMQDIIDEKISNIIIDEIFDYLSQEDFENISNIFLNETEKYVEKFNNKNESNIFLVLLKNMFNIYIVIISFIISITLILLYLLKHKGINQVNSYTYEKNNTFKLKRSSENFSYSTISKSKIKSKSSGNFNSSSSTGRNF